MKLESISNIKLKVTLPPNRLLKEIEATPAGAILKIKIAGAKFSTSWLATRNRIRGRVTNLISQNLIATSKVFLLNCLNSILKQEKKITELSKNLRTMGSAFSTPGIIKPKTKAIGNK